MNQSDLFQMFLFALGLPAFLVLLFLLLRLRRRMMSAGDVDEGQSFGGEYHD